MTTLPELATKLSKMIADWQRYLDNLANWSGGTGTMPLEDSGGTAKMVKTPHELERIVNAKIADIQNQFNKEVEKLNLKFPVGHILITMHSANPNSYGYIGTWLLLSEDMSLASTRTVGELGRISGSNTPIVPLPIHNHSASSSGGGSHSHTRGTMEISGSFNNGAQYFGSAGGANGVFRNAWSHNAARGTGTSYDMQTTSFYASRNWTGRTSSESGHSHALTVANAGINNPVVDVRGKNIKVYMWERTA